MTDRRQEMEVDGLRLSLDLYPSLNRFALDLVRNESTASKFCTRVAEAQLISSLPAPGLEPLAKALTASNQGWDNDVRGSVRSWITEETVTLIAGQQTGLGGGPFYTLAKIASLISLKRRCESNGRKAVAFFWLATEDHDLDEVSRLDVLTPDGVERIRGASAPSRRVVGSLPLPEDARARLCQLIGVDSSGWLTPGISFRDSFARLISEVVPGEIILVDSLLPELRQAGQPFLSEAIASLESIGTNVKTRSAAIEAAGYAPQIQPTAEGYSALYAIDDDSYRHPIRVVGGRAVIEGWDVDPLVLVKDHPERVSTAALTRPLLQDFVFRPSIFIGGPAEVSYYGQLGSLYERFSIRQPHVALRGHALVAPSRILSAFDRYGLEPEEIFESTDDVILRREHQKVDQLTAMIAELEDGLSQQLSRIEDLILPLDRTMDKSIQKTSRKIRYHFDRMRLRGHRVIARSDSDRHRAIERLHRHLFPEGVTQDRTLGWVSYWKTYGSEMVNRLIAEIEPDSGYFRILGL